MEKIFRERNQILEQLDANESIDITQVNDNSEKIIDDRLQGLSIHKDVAKKYDGVFNISPTPSKILNSTPLHNPIKQLNFQTIPEGNE